ncbi:MAG: sigma-70 family RNA polymerase sigma factor [Burkholderiales bacterium]|nr:sigma-70 family RNA polymerase sigma factor [Burkholderiales bacterium]
MAARYYQELLSYFSRALRDRDAAADVVQEAYARVLALQQAGQAVAEPRALLYRTARNLVIDRHRRDQVHSQVTVSEDAALEDLPAQRACEPDTLIASSQVLQAVLATIDALPLRCREAFILHRFDGLSHAEVAQRMSISRKAVEQHVQNAMLAIRQCRERMNGDSAPAAPALRRRNPSSD